jgi:polyphosphate kinase 2 (PPK2 family)
MHQAPEVERMLVGDNIRLMKFWFSVGRKEQLRRFNGRKTDPLKQWKLSPMDLASLDRWEDYTKAKEDMFFYTNTADAPWTVIKSNCKKRARLACMRYVLNAIPYVDKDVELVGQPDPLILNSGDDIFHDD